MGILFDYTGLQDPCGTVFVSFCIDLENCICGIYGTFCYCQNIESTFYILYIGNASGYEAYLDIFGGIYLSAK